MMVLVVIIAGLIIGSFLNVCIYRMPQEKSVVNPRSYCPHCKQTIHWYDNLPVISFILLGGRCRFCKGKISFRYAIVELLTAAVFVLLINQLGFNITTVIFMGLACALIVSTFIDFQHQIIPDEINYGGMILGIILSPVFPQLHNQSNRLAAFFDSALGLLAGGATIYATGVIGKLLFKKEAMGGGDVKFLAMIGSFVGWRHVLLIYFLAPFFGSVVGIIMKLRYKVDIIPYGPYLSLASLVVIVWGDRILKMLFPYLSV